MKKLNCRFGAATGTCPVELSKHKLVRFITTNTKDSYSNNPGIYMGVWKALHMKLPDEYVGSQALWNPLPVDNPKLKSEVITYRRIKDLENTERWQGKGIDYSELQKALDDNPGAKSAYKKSHIKQVMKYMPTLLSEMVDNSKKAGFPIKVEFPNPKKKEKVFSDKIQTIYKG